MKRLALAFLFLACAGAISGWMLSAPRPLAESAVAALPDGDAKAGELIFWAGGCSSCHAAPKSAGDAKLVLSGGLEFKTPFGIFRAPNLSPHKQAGIGAWSKEQFANAMLRGLSPDNSHYYPAFPYASYASMSSKDLADLYAFMQTLPASDNVAADHDLAFPFNIRRGLGLWKWLYFDTEPVLVIDEGDAVLQRGRYLVESLAHCGECHTPRNLIGGPDKSRWLAGGISPEGNEKIPNITPHEDGIGGWSMGDIVNSLETGFTPEFDSFGSTMADVQLNMAKLPASDRQAIAAYLKAVLPVEGKP